MTSPFSEYSPKAVSAWAVSDVGLGVGCGQAQGEETGRLVREGECDLARLRGEREFEFFPRLEFSQARRCVRFFPFGKGEQRGGEGKSSAEGEA